VRRLLNAGFSKKEIAIVVPEQFRKHFHPPVAIAQRPGAHAAAAIAAGGAVGATLRGLALVRTLLAAGGAGALPAIPSLLGGGAIGGGFSSLIVSDGYGKGVGEYYEQAIEFGRIVVGVEIDGPDDDPRLLQVEHILTEAGADPITPKESPREGAA